MGQFFINGEYQRIFVTPVFRDKQCVWVQIPISNKILPLMVFDISDLSFIESETSIHIDANAPLIDSYLDESITTFGIFKKETGKMIFEEEYYSPIDAQRDIANMIIGSGVIGNQYVSYKYLQTCEIRVVK